MRGNTASSTGSSAAARAFELSAQLFDFSPRLTLLLQRDATQRAVMPQYVVCLSVCPSVTFRYDFHTQVEILQN